jgi:hypothetical protein
MRVCCRLIQVVVKLNFFSANFTGIIRSGVLEPGTFGAKSCLQMGMSRFGSPFWKSARCGMKPIRVVDKRPGYQARVPLLYGSGERGT